MPGRVRGGQVAVGLLTENTSRMLAQAIRLVRSIRWFGGELAGARIVVCGVGPLEPRAHATLQSYGVEIRTVTRFHPANPTGNRHQLLAELLDAPQEVLFILDCDTLVVRDPLPYVTGDGFQAKIAPGTTVTDAVFERLFTHFGLRKPPRSYVTLLDATPTIPYFNAGVIAIPTALARVLAPPWRKYNQVLADDPQLAAPSQRHMHQAALTIALAETGIPVAELPAAMNYQINTPHLATPPAYDAIDPVILHYHHLATDDGFLLPTRYPGAQARIDLFHERMQAEGFAPDEAAPGEQQSRPVVVAGMHRSGTSLVAQLVNALGVYAGRPDELGSPDMFNPTGYWEHRDAVALDRDLLAGPVPDAAARAARVAQSLQGRGPFVLKDPRISLLFPLWREALGDPVCVIAWRDPMAVARSLAHRDDQPLLASLAAWEHYNRTLLRDSEGVPRVLVSYEQLLANPVAVARDLYDALTRFGIEGLTLPTEESVRQVVFAAFDRSGRKTKPSDATLLDADQRALLEGLSSGSALQEPIAPTSPRTLELLAEFDLLERTQQTMREQLRDRDLLLTSVFESRSWRVGHRATGLLRLLRRIQSVSAEERWRALRGQ